MLTASLSSESQDAVAKPSSVPDPMRKFERSTTPFFVACCIFLVVMEFLGMQSTKSLKGALDFSSFYAAGYMVRTEPARLYDLTQQLSVQNAHVRPTEIPLPYF